MNVRTVVVALIAMIGGIAAAPGQLHGTSAAPAQAYPSRPITMIVPYSAGGPTDTLAASWPSICGPRSVKRSSSRT